MRIPLHPKPSLSKPPRTILRVENDGLLFQSHRNLYLLEKDQCVFLGTCSEGEDLVYLGKNRVFIASIYENSELIGFDKTGVEVLASLKNLG